MSYKAFALLRRAPDSDWFAFRDYFRGEFVQTVLASPAAGAIRRVVANHVLERDFRPTTNADKHLWSALAEYYFADAETAIRTVQDPQFLAASMARPDMVEEVSHTVVVEELIHDQGPRPGASKVYGFYTATLPRGNPMTREAIRAHLAAHMVHMRDAKLDGLVKRLVQNRTLPGYHAANPRFDYDGASLVWFDTIEDAENTYKNGAVEKVTVPSTAAMGCEPGGCVYLRTDEAEVFVRT